LSAFVGIGRAIGWNCNNQVRSNKRVGTHGWIDIHCSHYWYQVIIELKNTEETTHDALEQAKNYIGNGNPTIYIGISKHDGPYEYLASSTGQAGLADEFYLFKSVWGELRDWKTVFDYALIP
jgi:hypothetical protein